MKVDIEEISSVERKLAFEIPWDTIQEELEKAYQGLSKRARVKGFRPGKVPRPILERMYKATVEGEVVHRLLDSSFKQAVSDHDLVPISSPELAEEPKLEPKEPLKFVATVEVKPEVVAQKYKGLAITQVVEDIADEQVDKELEGLRHKAAIVEEVTDRNELEQGDLAMIDFFGFVNGESFKGGKGINYTAEIGKGQMLPGFEEALVGMKVGEERKFELSFPKGQGPKEVQGKPVEWKVDLKEIKRKVLPEIDDEFAKDLGEYDNLAELRAKISENLATRQSAQSQRALRDQVLEKLADENGIEVPPKMVERQLDIMLQQVQQALKGAHRPELQETLTKLREESRPQAEKQVAGMLLLESVVRIEDIEISDAELSGRIQELSREHGIGLKQLRQRLKDEEQLEGLKYNMLQDKALDFLVNQAKITKEAAPQKTAEEE